MNPWSRNGDSPGAWGAQAAARRPPGGQASGKMLRRVGAGRRHRILFGPLGLLLGYPLAIVMDVAVRRLYVREALGEDAEIAGEDEK